MDKSIVRTLIFIFAAIALTACGSVRQSVALTPETGTAASTATGKYIPAGNSAVTRLTATYNDDWTSLRVPVSVALKAPKSMSVSGRLTVVNHTGLNMSVRALGFEVASLTVLGDSIYAYEKLGKRCVAESVKSLVADLGVSTDEVIDLMMGHLFMLGESTLTDGDDHHLLLLPVTTDPALQYGWTILNEADSLRPASFVVETGNRGGYITYGSFTETPAGPAAQSLDIRIATGRMVIAAEVTVNYNKAEWNGNFKIDRPSMKGYTKVAGSELLKIFNSVM